MAVSVDNFWNTGRVETNGKLAQSIKSTTNKKAESSNVFQALLNLLKPNESRATDGLRDKPASAEPAGRSRHRVSKHPGAILDRNEQNVNNLAASALIAMAALSSGPNRIGGFYSLGGGGLSLPGGSSNIAGVGRSASRPGSSLCSGQEIGALSAHFESGEKGPGMIGYDDIGGTSYGTYQISSRAGTMKLFVDYLSERAPDLASKLKAAGPSNTGSCSGTMPEVWKKMAVADPVRFEKLQYDFIENSHYLPAVQEISDRTGLDISKAPRAVREVLWSTAVQHGPRNAAKIFTKAIKRAQYTNDGAKMAQLIGSVYDMRAGQFGSSGSDVKAAVLSRFKEEGRIALAMLSNPLLNSGNLKA